MSPRARNWRRQEAPLNCADDAPQAVRRCEPISVRVGIGASSSVRWDNLSAVPFGVRPGEAITHGKAALLLIEYYLTSFQTFMSRLSA